MGKNTSIALGFFDGVHIAHQNIIASAVSHAKRLSLEPVVLTFDKSPQELLKKDVSYIMTTEEKEKICETLGAKLCLIETDMEFLSKEPEEFVKEVLLEKYNARHVSCGYNYRFGKGGKGDAELLKKLGEKYGFSVDAVECITNEGKEISSSRIRKLLKEGNIKEANELLGRRFSLTGEVCRGKQLGSTIGFPTANVFIQNKMLLPKNGVYETRTYIKGREYASITNVGVNPTVGGEALKTETYIHDLSESLYGDKIRIEFVRFLREEAKFSSVEALKMQISSDIRQILE